MACIVQKSHLQITGFGIGGAPLCAPELWLEMAFKDGKRPSGRRERQRLEKADRLS